MISGIGLLSLTVVLAVQGQRESADEIRVFAEQGDQVRLLDAVRQSPNATRTALGQVFEIWAAPGPSNDVAGHAAAARELALAYSEAWRDSQATPYQGKRRQH